ncbi:MAG TPA: UDP-N-acetylglucosamine 1-carboxyvinyltransferase [Candidatus Krumholzibacteria bacterium]|nr:UDP-N-acetylglucosamine 1-carboxyvinyltransferase [Candidatus Krumholzibacteria bacterium]HRX50788.1 UDP-N-acetylglucosamine 1-carboxyvinyltransferase [Candidatus Krumholzibacteria bacterium]
MDRFLIEGPVRLHGEVRCSGAKNAVLPLMAAALLSRGVSEIRNVPDLRDVRTFMRLLDILGARCGLVDGTLTIDTSGVQGCEAPYDLVKTMRASVYVLGPLTAFGGEARVSLPGGCAWGPRPVNLHLSGLEALGAEVDLDAGYIRTRAPSGGLRGGRFRFEPSSVGATCNVLMAAVLAAGVSELTNCAVEPEVTQLGRALVGAGAQIDGLGTTHLVVTGVERLEPLRCAVIPDRIEAGTFLAGAAMTGGDVTVTHCDPAHLEAVSAALEAMGCEVDEGPDRVRVRGPERLRPVEVVTRPYPAFATDMQAQLMACACVARGTSHLTETIYPDRFTHAAELRRLGADIRLDGATATVFGVAQLQGAPVMATDLRASAALVLAGCAARGVTTVDRVYHIDRGYERIEQKLEALGARIRREQA